MSNSKKIAEVWKYLNREDVRNAAEDIEPSQVSAVILQVLIQSGAGHRNKQEVIAKRIISELEKVKRGVVVAEAESEVLHDKLAAGVVEGMGGLHSVVDRHFEGVARDIASRHWAEVREERAARITRSILDALGAEERTSLTKLLEGAANAVKATLAPSPSPGAAVAKGPGPQPIADPAGTIAMAVSQAVQQVAFNVQKIITVAIEDARSGDGENPKYPYP